MQISPAKKLIVYVDEKDKLHHRPVYEVIVDILHRSGIIGVSIFRGIGGYGADGVMHTAKMLELSSDLPVRVVAVDAAERIDAVLPEVCAAVEKGLVEVTDTTIVKCPGRASGAES